MQLFYYFSVGQIENNFLTGSIIFFTLKKTTKLLFKNRNYFFKHFIYLNFKCKKGCKFLIHFFGLDFGENFKIFSQNNTFFPFFDLFDEKYQF